MIAFICLFFPAVFSIYVFEGLAKSDLNLKQLIFRFCTNCLLINLICFAVKKFIFQTADQPFFYISTDMTPSTALNYIIIAMVTAIIISVAEVLLSKKVKFSVEENAIEDNFEEEENISTTVESKTNTEEVEK